LAASSTAAGGSCSQVSALPRSPASFGCASGRRAGEPRQRLSGPGAGARVRQGRRRRKPNGCSPAGWPV